MFLFLLAEIPATLPQMGQSDHFLSEFFNMLITLGLLLLFLFFSLWFIKRLLKSRRRPSSHDSFIKILQRRSLTPKSTLYLVEILGKTVVLAESAHGIHFITEFPPKTTEECEEKVPPPLPKFSFAQLFSHLSKKGSSSPSLEK